MIKSPPGTRWGKSSLHFLTWRLGSAAAHFSCDCSVSGLFRKSDRTFSIATSCFFYSIDCTSIFGISPNSSWIYFMLLGKSLCCSRRLGIIATLQMLICSSSALLSLLPFILNTPQVTLLLW